jgi:hypothetical protein
MTPDVDPKQAFFRAFNSQYSTCLYPGNECPNRAINAHSIQNARVLDRLQVDGKVMIIQGRVHPEDGPTPTFTLVGRGAATTFRGLCNPHDTELFRPIEAADLDFANPEHRFLLAYRAVLREMYEKQKALRFTASISGDFVPASDIPDFTNPLVLAFASALEDAHSFAQVKWEYDRLFLSGETANVCSQIVALDLAPPVLAVSSLFGPSEDTFDASDPVSSRRCVAYSVLPFETRTVAIFTWLPQHQHFAEAQLNRLLTATGYFQAYILSKHILIHSDNFVMSPRHFASFSDEKRAAILRFFKANLVQATSDEEDQLLYLF